MYCEQGIQVTLVNGQWYTYHTVDSSEIKEVPKEIFRIICNQDSVYIKDTETADNSYGYWFYHGKVNNSKIQIAQNISGAYYSNKVQTGWLGSVFYAKKSSEQKWDRQVVIKDRIQDVIEKEGLFYIGTASECLTYDIEEKLIEPINEKPIDIIKIEVYNDRLIFATKGDGVHQLVNNKIEKLSLALPNQSCNDMLVSGDTMYVATGNGVAVVNLLVNTVKLLQKKTWFTI